MRASRRAAILRVAAALAFGAVVAPAGFARASGGALFASQDEAEAALFVLERFLDGGASIDEIADLYAEEIDYFAVGRLKRERVLDYRRAFLSRWSKIAYTPDLDTIVVTRRGEDGFLVVVEVDFLVSNASAELRGRSRSEITLSRRGEGFAVVGEGGEVLQQAR